MDRRKVLALLGVAGAAGLTGVALLRQRATSSPNPETSHGDILAWRNWSGNQISYPANRFGPRNEDELRTILMESSGPVRAVGSGHSFSPLVPTDTTMISLDRIRGVKSVDPEAGLAVLNAGGKLARLSPELETHGVAFPNLPDINKQTLAGAISTATHGSGKNAPSMSADVRSLRLVAANGDILECSSERNADLFAAAQVSLGALGIITQAGYHVEPSHYLERKTWVEPYDTLMSRATQLFETHRSFEFFYVPFTGHCLAIAHNKTDNAPSGNSMSDDNEGLVSLKKLRDTVSFIPPLRRALGRSAIKDIEAETVSDTSWKLLSSERTMRFNELEYHMPVAQAFDTLDEIIGILERDHRDVFFPIEVRYIKGDTAWLSPFEGCDRISIAVHVHHEDDYQFLFTDIEPVMKRRGGRPHRGKLNTLESADFKELYRHWDDFKRVRQEVDPKAKLLNSYLRKVFDVDIQA